MAIVSSDTLQLAAVRETVPGQTPANPTFELWRTTGEGVVFAPQTTDSAELGGTGRMRKPANVTGMTVSGDINFELAKFAALEEAISGVLANNWGECPLTGASSGAADSADRIISGRKVPTFTIEKRFKNPLYVKGDIVTVTAGAPGATSDITVAAPGSGLYEGTGLVVVEVAVDGGDVQHVSVPIEVGDDENAVAAALAAALTALTGMTAAAAGAVVTITPDTATVDSLTVHAGADQYLYQRFKGVTYSSLSLNITPNAVITGSVGIVGGSPELDTMPLPGATYNSAGSNPVFTAPQVVEMAFGDLNAGKSCFTELTINIDSQNRGVACLGTLGERETITGLLAVDITGSVYFTDNTYLEALRNNEEITDDGWIILSDGAGNYYRFDFYDLRPVGGQVSAGGAGQDLLMPIALQPTPGLACLGPTGEHWDAGMVISRDASMPTHYCEPTIPIQILPLVNQPAGQPVTFTPIFVTPTVFHVDWGDGQVDRYKLSGVQVSHTYAAVFNGNVTIIGCV